MRRIAKCFARRTIAPREIGEAENLSLGWAGDFFVPVFCVSCVAQRFLHVAKPSSNPYGATENREPDAFLPKRAKRQRLRRTCPMREEQIKKSSRKRHLHCSLLTANSLKSDVFISMCRASASRLQTPGCLASAAKAEKGKTFASHQLLPAWYNKQDILSCFTFL